MPIPNITVDQIIDALASFISNFNEGGDIVRGQVNRVSPPQAPFVVLTEVLQKDLSLPYSTYDGNAQLQSLNAKNRIDIQVDMYGANAGIHCQGFVTAFRTGWGFDQFPESIKPLYTSDPVQAPLTTAEQQYESRWTITVSLQYNPKLSVNQQFAEELATNIVEAIDL